MNRKTFIKNTGFAVAGMSLLPPSIVKKKRDAENPYAFVKLSQSPLKYSTQALEPYISAQIMDIHYHKHAAGYLRKTLKAIEKNNLSQKSLFDIITSSMNDDDFLINNLGGHFNHEIFWRSLSKDRSLIVSETFTDRIRSDFGGIEKLQEIFSEAAAGVFGSGWAWIGLDPTTKKLVVTTTPNQDNPLMLKAEHNVLPLVGIDVWEHAYYLQYQNRRKDYIKAYGEILDWGFADTMYQKITKWIR